MKITELDVIQIRADVDLSLPPGSKAAKYLVEKLINHETVDLSGINLGSAYAVTSMDAHSISRPTEIRFRLQKQGAGC